MYICNYLYYIYRVQSLFYVATISKIVRFYNVYFLGQIMNLPVCLSDQNFDKRF